MLKLLKTNRIAQLVLASIVLTTVLLLWAYISAPSTVNVPKAEQYNDQANVLMQQSAQAEAVANTISAYRQEARKDTLTAKGKLNQRKSNYEKTRNTNTTIDRTDLDSRERRLQSDLEHLYPTR